MDDAVERAEAENAFAIAHASDNSADYVAGRFSFLHVQPGVPVPTRRGLSIEGVKGRLFPIAKRGGFACRSAHPSPGIVVMLTDEETGQVAEYRVETNSANGVEVAGRA